MLTYNNSIAEKLYISGIHFYAIRSSKNLFLILTITKSKNKLCLRLDVFSRPKITLTPILKKDSLVNN